MRNCAKLATSSHPYFVLSQPKFKNIKSINKDSNNKKKSCMNVTSYPHPEVVKSDIEIYKLGDDDEGHFLYSDEKIQLVTKNGIKNYIAVDDKKQLNYVDNENYASADDTFIFIIGIFMSVMPFFKLEDVNNGKKTSSPLNKTPSSERINSKYDPFYVFMQSIKEKKTKKNKMENGSVSKSSTVVIDKQNSNNSKKEELNLVKIQEQPVLKNGKKSILKNGKQSIINKVTKNDIQDNNITNKPKEQHNLKTLCNNMIYTIQHGYQREEYRKINQKNNDSNGNKQLLEAPKIIKDQKIQNKSKIEENVLNGKNEVLNENSHVKTEEEKQKEYDDFVEHKTKIIKEIRQNIEARNQDKNISNGRIKLNKKIKDFDLDIMDLIVDLALLSTHMINVNNAKLKPYLKDNKKQNINNQSDSDSYLYI